MRKNNNINLNFREMIHIVDVTIYYSDSYIECKFLFFRFFFISYLHIIIIVSKYPPDLKKKTGCSY